MELAGIAECMGAVAALLTALAGLITVVHGLRKSKPQRDRGKVTRAMEKVSLVKMGTFRGKNGKAPNQG